jgi:hypothetical protein
MTNIFMYVCGVQTVAEVIEVFRYQPEGHWFDTQWCRWNFSLAILPLTL